MDLLSSCDKTIFIGQSIKYGGTGLYDTLLNVSDEKKIEWPVAEYLQMGASIGLGLEGFIVVTLFPRWNFLLLAANQVVNHLDKIKIMSNGDYTPKVIIRTSIGSQRPLHPQHQHIADFTAGFKAMCDWIDIIRLDEPHQIFESFKYAYERTDNRPTILVEWGDYYGEK